MKKMLLLASVLLLGLVPQPLEADALSDAIEARDVAVLNVIYAENSLYSLQSNYEPASANVVSATSAVDSAQADVEAAYGTPYYQDALDQLDYAYNALTEAEYALNDLILQIDEAQAVLASAEAALAAAETALAAVEEAIEEEQAPPTQESAQDAVAAQETSLMDLNAWVAEDYNEDGQSAYSEVVGRLNAAIAAGASVAEMQAFKDVIQQNIQFSGQFWDTANARLGSANDRIAIAEAALAGSQWEEAVEQAQLAESDISSGLFNAEQSDFWTLSAINNSAAAAAALAALNF